METKIKFKIKTTTEDVTPKEVPASNIFNSPTIILKVGSEMYEFGYECSFDDTTTYDENEKVYVYCDSGEIDRQYEKLTASAKELADSELILVYFEFDTIDNNFHHIGDVTAEYNGYYLELVTMSFCDEEEFFVSEDSIKQYNKTQKDWANQNC